MTPSELRTFIEGMEAAGMTTPTPEQWAVIREKLMAVPTVPGPSDWVPSYPVGPIRTVPMRYDPVAPYPHTIITC